MTYVITEPCIGEKNGACVDVCPAACIHTTPDAPQNYIDPDVCIECEQCVLVCPVNAIFLDREVPAEWTRYIDVNAEVDPERVLLVPGGFPVVDTGDTLGAVGVAGAASPDQDILCCQAALAALMGHALA